jgi:hypothetical protein
VSITPAIAFPILSAANPGEILGWERRAYDDLVAFTAVPEPGAMVLFAVAAALAGLRRWAALAAVIAAGSVTASAAPVLALARPVDQARFTATTFATGLSFPTSMAELADGSLPVAETRDRVGFPVSGDLGC